MNGTAPYRALVEAGASEERAKAAAESVAYTPEAATRSDVAAVEIKVAQVDTRVAEVRTEITETRAELLARISGLETIMERTFRTMAFRLAGLFLGMQALFFAAMRLTGST